MRRCALEHFAIDWKLTLERVSLCHLRRVRTGFSVKLVSFYCASCKKQRIATKFCVKHGKSVVETFMVKAKFDDNCFSERKVFR